MPEIIWLKVFGYLSPSELETPITNVHLTCRKFHDLASLVPCHLYLTTVLSSDENMEAFKKSSQIYDKVRLDNFRGLTEEIQLLSQVITLLEPTRMHVKELRIADVYLSKFDVTSLLKLFPNLKTLVLENVYPSEDPSPEQRYVDVISLPKLTHFTICDCHKELEDLVPINNLRLCLVLGCFRNVLGTFYKGVFKNHS